MVSQQHSQDTPPVPRLSYTVLPTQKHTFDQAADSSLFSSPGLLERCIVSDLSCGVSPATSSSWMTPCNSMTPLSVDGSCKRATRDDMTDVQETPLSVRSGRKRKHQKRRMHRSTLPGSGPVDSSDTGNRNAAEARVKGCSSDIAVKLEPKMPKLLPEPRVEYNPETPLRISIHLPLNGVMNAAEDGLLSEKIGQSEAVHGFNDNREMCSAGGTLTDNPSMPVDLTSRASVHVASLPTSASSAAEVKPYSFVSSVSSSAGPVYSPISSMSCRSSPDVENEDTSSHNQEMPQPSVGIIASFLDRFSGMPAESLQFSPSQSFWTRSFAEHLAEVNQNSFAAVHNLPAPLLSPAVTATDQRTEANSFHPASHSSLMPVSSTIVNSRSRHNIETRDCVAVRPTVSADSPLNRVLNINLSNANERDNYKVDMKMPLLSNGDCHLSKEAVSLNDMVSSETIIVPGMVALLCNFCNFDIHV